MTFGLALLSASIAGLWLSGVQAEDATTVTAAGCVDVSGMQSCLNSATDAWETCLDTAETDNEVYSCEYQLVVVDILGQVTPAEDAIPFWPPPANAPGGCACNFAELWDGVTAALEDVPSACTQYVTALDSLQTCECCAWSSVLSVFYGTCPGYDLTNFGLASVADTVNDSGTMIGTCGELTSPVCEGQFGIGSSDNGTYPDPQNLPDSGSKTLSTTEGPGLLTTPPGGVTVTQTILDGTFTITAATYGAANVGATGASDTSSSSPSTSDAQASATDSSSSTGTTQPESASTRNMAGTIMFSLALALMLML
ncbi:hypothetical protein BJX99DRAFT_259188 [Aspergillus californicus]